MMLAIRTDAPEAMLRLYDADKLLESFAWEAHRALAETITIQIQRLLARHQVTLRDIDKVVVFSGPGSFTGLRIGVSVANALGYSLDVPVTGVDGSQWASLPDLPAMNDKSIVLPVYGSEPRITLPKK